MTVDMQVRRTRFGAAALATKIALTCVWYGALVMTVLMGIVVLASNPDHAWVRGVSGLAMMVFGIAAIVGSMVFTEYSRPLTDREVARGVGHQEYCQCRCFVD